MGPGSFDPGNILAAVGVTPDDAALQWGRGLLTPEMSAAPTTAPSTPPLQWGRGLLTPEIIRLRTVINAEDAELQWGRGLLTPEMPRRSMRGGDDAAASMGPGSFDPGNATGRAVRRPPRHRFNGAGVF